MERRQPVRINLGAPYLGQRSTRGAVRTRAARDAQRFIGGFLAGVTLVVAIFLTALSLGLLTPSVDWRDPWPVALDREARVSENREVRRIADMAAEHRTLGQVLEQAERDDWLTRLVGPSLPATPAEVRAARLMQNVLGRELLADLEAWDARLAEVRAMPAPAQRATIHVLSIARWQLEGGELEQAMSRYERRLAALPAPVPPVVAEP